MDTSKYEKFYHVCAWIFTVTCTTLPFLVDDAYGFNGLWCWLTDKQGKIFWWTVFYGPLICIWFIVIILYIMIYRTARLNLENVNITSEYKKYTNAILKLSRAYPAIFVIFYIIPLVNRFQNSISPNNIFILVLLQVITAPLMGFACAVAFCYYNEQSPEIPQYGSVDSSDSEYISIKKL